MQTSVPLSMISSAGIRTSRRQNGQKETIEEQQAGASRIKFVCWSVRARTRCDISGVTDFPSVRSGGRYCRHIRLLTLDSHRTKFLHELFFVFFCISLSISAANATSSAVCIPPMNITCINKLSASSTRPKLNRFTDKFTRECRVSRCAGPSERSRAFKTIRLSFSASEC